MSTSTAAKLRAAQAEIERLQRELDLLRAEGDLAARLGSMLAGVRCAKCRGKVDTTKEPR